METFLLLLGPRFIVKVQKVGEDGGRAFWGEEGQGMGRMRPGRERDWWQLCMPYPNPSSWAGTDQL